MLLLDVKEMDAERNRQFIRVIDGTYTKDVMCDEILLIRITCHTS